MKLLVVDDSKPARQRLERLLGERDGITVVSSADGHDALELAQEGGFDAALLDIEMPGMGGLELAQRLLDSDPSLAVVFVTAYDQYALDAYESGGVGYLLKPVEGEKLFAKLDQVVGQKKQAPTPQPGSRLVLVRSGSRVYPLKPEEIIYVKADLDEVIVRSAGVSGYVARRFYEMENLLLPFGFFKIHRSHLVNLNHMKSMESVEQSKLVISFHGIDEQLTSSKEGAKKLRDYLETL